MLAYLSLLQQLISLDGGGRQGRVIGVNLNMAGIGAMVFGLAAAFGAVIFAMIALQGWLAMVIESVYAVPLAWLCVAGLTFAVAGVAIIIAKADKQGGLISLAYAQPEPRHAKSFENVHVNGTGHKAPFDESFVKNMTEEFAGHIEEHPIAAVVLAGLAGVAAGKSINE